MNNAFKYKKGWRECMYDDNKFIDDYIKNNAIAYKKLIVDKNEIIQSSTGIT